MADHSRNLGNYYTVVKELDEYDGDLEEYKNSIASERLAEEAPSIWEAGRKEGRKEAIIGTLAATAALGIIYAIIKVADRYGPSISVKLAEVKGAVHQKLFLRKVPPAAIDGAELSEPSEDLDVSDPSEQS